MAVEVSKRSIAPDPVSGWPQSAAPMIDIDERWGGREHPGISWEEPLEFVTHWSLQAKALNQWQQMNRICREVTEIVSDRLVVPDNWSRCRHWGDFLHSAAPIVEYRARNVASATLPESVSIAQNAHPLVAFPPRTAAPAADGVA